MVGWRGKQNGSGDRCGSTNDNLFQYINIMRGSRNFLQEFSRDMGVQIPFPAPPFNKSMQERIQIIMHKNRLPTIANWLRDQRVHHNAKCWQLCNVSATSALDVIAHCFRGLIGDWIWHLFPTWDFWFN